MLRGSPLTRVSDDDVFEEVRVRHGPVVPVRTAVSTYTVCEWMFAADGPFSPLGAVRRNNKQRSVSALRHTARPRHATVCCLQGRLGVFAIANSKSH